jgi:hypothetical protein
MRSGWRGHSVLVTISCLALLAPSPAGAAPVDVRFLEGVTRGFLVLRSTTGQTLAQGDLIQTAHPNRVDSQMVFRFKDGSLYDERVTFSQQHVFSLLSYRLIEKGPSFPEPMDISFERTQGRYRITSTEKGREKTSSGTLDLPPDVYNGMIVMILRNLPAGRAETVHFVAFTPTPRVIQLELEPAGEQKLQLGDQEAHATRFAVTPKLGILLGLAARVLGKKPSSYECLIWTKDVPAFIRCDGPLRLNGPVYRFELVDFR